MLTKSSAIALATAAAAVPAAAFAPPSFGAGGAVQQRQAMRMGLVTPGSCYSGYAPLFSWTPGGVRCVPSPWTLSRELARGTSLPGGVLDPETTETDAGYSIAFKNLKGKVREDDVKVSVTDRFLTVQAETADVQESKANDGRVLFSRKSSGQVSRGFVLPENADVSALKSSWENGVFTVTLPKRAGTAAAAAAAAAAPESAEAAEAKPAAASTSDYLSSLSSAKQQQQQPQQNGPVGSQATATAAQQQTEGEQQQQQQQQQGVRPKSVWSMLDEFEREVREAEKESWQRRKEMFEAANKQRAARLLERRRQTMAIDVSQSAEAYKVVVDLPRGTTRADVNLSVTERSVLEVAVEGKGARRLNVPNDADVEAVAAKFEFDAGIGSEGDAESVGLVAQLVVTIPRAQPKRNKIEIA